MKLTVLNGNSVEKLREIPNNHFHMCATSPPYYHQRSYLKSDHPLKSLELGQEGTPEEYIAGLVDVFSEVRRVLRDDGTLWVVIDDKVIKGETAGLPWRFALAMKSAGWKLILDIIWNKPNPTPQSVRLKPTRAHEYVFLFSRTLDYYFDQDAIRTPYAETTIPRQMRGVSDNHKHANGAPGQTPHSMSRPRLNVRDIYNGEATKDYASASAQNPSDTKRRILESLMKHGGANKKSVWTIPKGSFAGNHFATFPADLVKPMILSGTSEKGCCSACGSPFVRVIGRTRHVNKRGPAHVPVASSSKTTSTGWAPLTYATGEWEASCACGSDSVPCRVIDIFGGSGTVGEVCGNLDRDCTLIELNDAYIPMIMDRTETARLTQRLL